MLRLCTVEIEAIRQLIRCYEKTNLGTVIPPSLITVDTLINWGRRFEVPDLIGFAHKAMQLGFGTEPPPQPKLPTCDDYEDPLWGPESL